MATETDYLLDICNFSNSSDTF